MSSLPTQHPVVTSNPRKKETLLTSKPTKRSKSVIPTFYKSVLDEANPSAYELFPSHLQKLLSPPDFPNQNPSTFSDSMLTVKLLDIKGTIPTRTEKSIKCICQHDSLGPKYKNSKAGSIIFYRVHYKIPTTLVRISISHKTHLLKLAVKLNSLHTSNIYGSRIVTNTPNNSLNLDAS